jgi:hypothetical protein
MRPDSELVHELRRVQLPALVVGVIGAVICVIAAVRAPSYFYPAYLVAFLFWWGVSLGSLALSLLNHLTGGGWGRAIRRVTEAAYSTLPLMAIAFIPILFGMQPLYEWARPDAIAHDQILQHKVDYLNVPFFTYRAIGYFVAWVLLSLLVSWLSAGHDVAGESRRRRYLSLLAGPGLILWVMTVTFASIDWAMSLEPHWFSSMFPVIFLGGQGISALSFAIIVTILLRMFRPIGEVATGPRMHDLGNLLLAFVMFWTYVSFTQYLIIWSGNLPEETPWYIKRSTNGWQYVAVLMIVLNFIVPFLLLLARQSKRNLRRFIGIAALLIGMRLIDLYWTVMPTFAPDGFWLNGMILVTPLAIGGFWLAWFTWQLPGRLALPVVESVPEEETLDELEHAST